MTDFAGTEEPTRADEQALDDPAVIPIRPGAAGVAGAPVIGTNGDPSSGSMDGEALAAWVDDDEEPTAADVDHTGGLMDAVRGLLGRGKVR